MMRRVVITGMGAVTPLGGNLSSTWNNLLACKSGVGRIESFNVDDYPCQIAGLIPFGDGPDQFNDENYIPAKELRRIDRFISFGIAAAAQAIADSGWHPTSDADLDRTGVMIGSGIGGLKSLQDTSILIKESGPRRVSPFFIPSCLINLISGHVSIKYGFRGPNSSVVTACSTGAHAIGDAARIIACGDAEVMAAGGAEAPICENGLAGFSAARALSTNFNNSPQKASRPWDKSRDGFVMGEGAGVVILEEYEHAKKRGAKIYAELAGYGLTGDGHHITTPHPEGLGARNAMSMAMKKSGLELSDITYINAHGTSTPIGDEIELKNVTNFFGDHAKKLFMSSTKSSIGHLLGAAGSVEAIFSIMALNHNIAPATLNLDEPPADNVINLVPHAPIETKIKAVLTNSFGFGGTNATLIFTKP